MTESNDLHRALAAALTLRAEGADQDQGRSSGLPEPEELLEYLKGRLSPEREDELQERIAADPEASRRLLDLQALLQAGDYADGRGAADLAAAAGWRELQGRLARGSLPGGQEVPLAARPPAVTPGSPAPGPAAASAARSLWAQPWLQGLAAALLITALGLAILLPRQAKAPFAVANLQTLELRTEERSAEAVQEVTVAAGEPVRLVLSPEEVCPAYRLVIEGPGSPPPVEGLVRQPGGWLDALLPLPAGAYTAILHCSEPERELERHRFRILEAP